LFKTEDYPQLLVGLETPDDSAVYALDSERALILTTDFFPPVVDDAFTFGAIAAANALSDVYAMGGQPLLAINLAAFPDGLDMNLLSEIMRGGAEKVREAGALVVGGHTVADKEPKYGLCVIGEVHPEKVIRKQGAQPGDHLILTKPIGAGLVTTALKQQRAEAAHIEAVVAGMLRLNKVSAELAQVHRVNALTDITGYGLIGHAYEVARASQVTLEFRYEALQWYPGAEMYARAEIVPGGTGRNRAHFSQWAETAREFDSWQLDLLHDPQTSGGLLMSVPEQRAEALLADLLAAGETAFEIGRVTAGPSMIRLA